MRDGGRGAISVGKEFRDFVMRGNVVDLAVGVVIGAAFGTVVTALVSDFITPLVTIPTKGVRFETLHFTIGGSDFLWGHFVNALISFIIIAAVVFFFVVKPTNMLMTRAKRGELPADPTTRECPHCLSTIPLKASRCAYCTQEVAPVTVGATVQPS
jgi:large conductance mechanosensitive channel